MKLMLVFAVLAVIAVSQAAPQGGKDTEILEYNVDNSGLGDYKFSYKLSDGTTRTEEGTVINPGTENEAISVRGSISWVAPDGQTYTINFVADENGFQPDGDHIPKK